MALGEILKQKRLERGWTKENIAERTHMLVRSIEALETENFKRIPAPIYGRGFIKQYCRLLDIDPQPLIDDYMQAIDSTYVPARTVTRPAVNDLPSRPPEPIHTGAHRILPPQKDELPIISTTHKLVEPAEESYTSVPKPEGARTAAIGARPEAAAPVFPRPAPVTEPIPQPHAAPEPAASAAPETAAAPDDAADTAADMPREAYPAPDNADTSRQLTPDQVRRLTGDVPSEGAAAESAAPEAAPHRDLFAPTPKRPRREVRPAAQTYPHRDPNASIFAPQQPVREPPSPQLTFLRDLLEGIRSKVAGLFRPHVRRIRAGEVEPLMTRALVLRSVTILGILVVLTVLVFVFRFVFRASANAETETPLTGQTETSPSAGTYTPRPVDTPPMPFFTK